MLNVRDNRRQLSRRVELARYVVGGAFALLATCYWYVQILRGDYYFTLSEYNRIRSVKVTAPRGYILDRRLARFGPPLADERHHADERVRVDRRRLLVVPRPLELGSEHLPDAIGDLVE